MWTLTTASGYLARTFHERRGAESTEYCREGSYDPNNEFRPLTLCILAFLSEFP